MSERVAPGKRKQGVMDPTTTNEGSETKRHKSPPKSDEHKKFALQYYANHVSCASYQEFEAGLPEEFWTCEDLEAFPKEKLNNIMFPQLRSPLLAPQLLQAVTETITFFERIVGYVNVYNPPDAVILRHLIDILKTVPHEQHVYNAVLGAADAVVKRLLEDDTKHLHKTCDLNLAILRGGAVTNEIAILESERQRSAWRTSVYSEWKSVKKQF
ncbi:uncharacterized protein EI97DRAFT_471048 [Westerdykella ornata]|uniref:Uncharacterized protein n=1 Tax=Westerdykella ornata TaxID=318751 RepID=A0A6A6J6M2_WESOR|nr:uncharacterized protein EI97DRAFT_471048 [Westerdykella ornata]KAF2271618.1 hypothetical protein EI97DRAFT_471048 [Westerdykella ornata]